MFEWLLFKNNSKIYSRSTTDSLETDFLLWSNKTFKSKLALHSIKASQNEAILQNLSEVLSISIWLYYPEKLNEQNLYEYLLNENITYLTTTLNSWNIETSIFAKSKILYTVIQIPFNP
jgi:phage pi2 protein 07